MYVCIYILLYKGGGSGSGSDRLLSCFLTELDGIKHNHLKTLSNNYQRNHNDNDNDCNDYKNDVILKEIMIEILMKRVVIIATTTHPKYTYIYIYIHLSLHISLLISTGLLGLLGILGSLGFSFLLYLVVCIYGLTL